MSKYQFIKNCFGKGYLMNKNYRKYNIIDNCKFIEFGNKKRLVHYTEKSIEFIPLDCVKPYKH